MIKINNKKPKLVRANAALIANHIFLSPQQKFVIAILSASSAQPGHGRELGFEESLSQLLTVLTEQGRMVCLQISSAALACVKL
ncbi:hypothetical protein [Aeromonas hydrophila]|uniref:hypothetical protein n=1 Tax=Aeromonas hydrophila TaxID=644 RepID=UPI0022576C9A|nr:hypothetical protein [Aeromonas hydrophila]MCX4117354.1 hypothetical protein [Aeromonas hydrophila]